VKILKQIFEAFLCEPKNGEGKKFSTKKFFALIFCLLAIIEKVKLVIIPDSHFSYYLTQAAVPESVIISLAASLDALALGALTVYGWAKVRKAP
jgi:hypothetical protein